jgi:hypothetical protein
MWHQWHHTALIESSAGLPDCAASSKADSPQLRQAMFAIPVTALHPKWSTTNHAQKRGWF